MNGSEIRASSENLERFLREDLNSKTKEALINYRLFYELKLAAALAGYSLAIYQSDVDRDGFDVILDDFDTSRKIQLKTVMASSTTSSWDIHRSILRPHIDFADRLGFGEDTFGIGVQGAVILIVLTPKDGGINVSYFVTDVFIISAFRFELIKKESANLSVALKKFFREIRGGSANSRIAIPKSLFIEAKSINHLLALLGFHSIHSHMWQHHLLGIADDFFGKPRHPSTVDIPIEKLKLIVADELVEYTNSIEVHKSLQGVR